MNAYRLLSIIALLSNFVVSANITVLDANNIVQLDSDVHNKTDLCNELKLRDLSTFDIVYVLESVNDDNVEYFNEKINEAEAQGNKLNVKQLILKSSDIDNESFSLCMDTLKVKSFSSIKSEKSNIEQIFDNKLQNTIVLFEDATANNFMMEARVLADKVEVPAMGGTTINKRASTQYTTNYVS